MGFDLVSIEEKCGKIDILYLKCLWRITTMLVNPQIQKVSEICGYVLGFIHILYGHCFKLLALHFKVCQDASYKQIQFTMTLRQHDVYVALH